MGAAPTQQLVNLIVACLGNVVELAADCHLSSTFLIGARGGLTAML